MEESKIIIFTDGSSRGNPGPGGWGAIISTNEKVVELGGSDEHTTNNRMELTAAIEALDKVSGAKGSVEIFSDSKYVINGITSWVHSWMKNGWVNSQNKPVENKDLWVNLYDLAKDFGKRLGWQYVAGHNGHDANERCDEIATSFADKSPTELYEGSRSQYAVSFAAPSATGGVSKAFYISMVDGVVENHSSWDACEKRVKGKSGAKFKKVKNQAEAERVESGWRA